MTMVDEEILAGGLRRAADEFVGTPDAAERILAIARADEPADDRGRTAALIHRTGRTRTILLAAAMLILVTAISVPLVRDEGGPPAERALKTVHGDATPLPQRGASTGVTVGRESAPGGSLAVAGSGFGQSAAATTAVQKIESTGTVKLIVGDGRVSTTLKKLSNLAATDGGLVASSRADEGARGTGPVATGTIVLDVPQRRFARAVEQVQHLGRPASVVTNSSNVTGQYVDLQSRIQALEASRAQYLRIMTRATTISGILAVQNQIDNLQSQIEQDQGQLRVLNHQTSYGALTVNVVETGRPSVAHRSGFAKAWHNSVRGFVDGFEWLVRVAGPVLFAMVILAALVALGGLLLRSVRRRRI